MNKSTFLPPIPVKGTPGPFPGFLRLFPLSVGLYRYLHLLRAKDPLDLRIAGVVPPQGIRKAQNRCGSALL